MGMFTGYQGLHPNSPTIHNHSLFAELSCPDSRAGRRWNGIQIPARQWLWGPNSDCGARQIFTLWYAFIKLYSGSVWVKKNVKLDNWDTHKLDGFGASVSSWTWPKITPDNFHIVISVRQHQAAPKGNISMYQYFFLTSLLLFVHHFFHLCEPVFINSRPHILRRPSEHYHILYTCISRCTTRLVCLHV